MLKSNSTIIRVNHKIVGQVVGDTFVKKVKASRHMLREPRGWGFDVESLQSAVDLGAEVVEVRDTETDTTYLASISRIVDKGFRFNRGHGPQICLPLKFWSVQRPGESAQLTLALGVMP